MYHNQTQYSTVVCIGVANHDVIASIRDPVTPDGRILADNIIEGGGGNAATAAVTLARLGISVDFIGRVGDDDIAHSIRTRLQHEGIGISGLRTIPGGRSPSSVVLVNLHTAERSIIACPAIGSHLQLDQYELEACETAQWIHVDQTGFPAVQQIRAAGIATPISLDAGNPIPDLDLRHIDLYAPTQSALCRTMGTQNVADAMRLALARGPRIVAVTCGPDGSLAAIHDHNGAMQVFTAPALQVPSIVSTLGAGDVFHGALLAGLVHRLALTEALRYANAAAALSCRGMDARSAIPTRAELEAFFDNLI